MQLQKTYIMEKMHTNFVARFNLFQNITNSSFALSRGEDIVECSPHPLVDLLSGIPWCERLAMAFSKKRVFPPQSSAHFGIFPMIHAPTNKGSNCFSLRNNLSFLQVLRPLGCFCLGQSLKTCDRFGCGKTCLAEKGTAMCKTDFCETFLILRLKNGH